MKAGGAGFWIRTAFLFLWRSGRATAALSIMVVTAVAALIFLSALAVGVKDAMLRNTVGLFSGHITGKGVPASVAPKDLMLHGVAAVLKRIYRPGVIAAGEIAQPMVLCGIESDREARVTALEQKIGQGRYPAAGRDEVLISRETARALGLGLGDRLRFSPRSSSLPLALTVSGIYRTGLDALDRGIAFVSLDRIAAPGISWSAAVFLRTGVEADTLIRDYRRQVPKPAVFESWETRMPDLRQLIDLEAVSMALVIFLVFGVVAIGIACSFVIFIIRNLREYGILKAMGVSRGEMAALIMAKVLVMNVSACAVGLLVGVLASLTTAHAGGIDIGAWTSHNRYFAVSGVIVPRLTVFSLWAPPVTAFCFSLLAAVWPAVLVSRKKAADILRMV